MNIFENRFYQFLLFPFSLIYEIIISIRNLFYDKNIFRSLKISNCKVISVGNISVGGTGKTPVIHFLANYLQKRGISVAILSRGYRRKSKGPVIVSDGKRILAGLNQAGDEPYLLARQLKSIPVVVEADRYKGALLIQGKFKPDVILLDDGFQHRRLHRDLNIVLIDASVGFGRGFLLPAGFLREPLSSLKRADLIWFTRIDQSRDFDRLIEQVRKFSSAPRLTSEHRAIEVVEASSGRRLKLSFLNQKRIYLFSGIANPGSFEKTIVNLGARLVHHRLFSDHYQYTPADIKKVTTHANNVRCDIILTTEKDYIRLCGRIPNLSKIYYLAIEIRISDQESAVQNSITTLLS